LTFISMVCSLWSRLLFTSATMRAPRLDQWAAIDPRRAAPGAGRALP
jgi:hypothetical protein